MKQKLHFFPLTLWCLVVATTIWAFLFLEPSGDGSTRGFTFIWIGLAGFVGALFLAFIAARMARDANGTSAQFARALPTVTALLVLVPLAFRVVVALIAPF